MGRKVHHCLRFVFRQGCIDGSSIGQISLDEGGMGMHGIAMALIEVVEDHDRLAHLDQLLNRHAADVAGAACDQNAHVSFASGSKVSGSSRNRWAACSGVKSRWASPNIS